MGGQVLLPVELGLSGRPPLDPLLTLDFPNIESFSVTGIMSLDDESVVAPRAGEECRGVRGAKFYNRWHNLVEFQLVQRDVRRRVGVPSLMSIFTGTDEEGNVDIMERTFLPNLRYLMVRKAPILSNPHSKRCNVSILILSHILRGYGSTLYPWDQSYVHSLA